MLFQANYINTLVSSRCRPVRWVHLWAGAKGFAIAQTFRVCVTWQIWILGGGGYGCLTFPVLMQLKRLLRTSYEILAF